MSPSPRPQPRSGGRGNNNNKSNRGDVGRSEATWLNSAAGRRSEQIKARKARLAAAAEAAGDVAEPVSDEPVERQRWVPERWQDEGPLRAAASEAASRARGEATPRTKRVADPARLDPSWVEDVHREATPATSARYAERLAAATEALERDRYRDALRMVSTVLKNLPNVGAAHEVAGLAHYRLGEFRKAAVELELAQQLHPKPEQLPVLADCYRALRRYKEVDRLWKEIRESSPAPAVMAEGRIVAAGALADRGDVNGALAIMMRAADMPKRVREHHLKQWYVIADLYDRSGDIPRARSFFKRIVSIDPRYADVTDRLSALGRR